MAGLIYYSQKTGDMTGDSTAWNTARGGGGASAVPDEADVRVVQDGHTITTVEPGVLGPIYGEDGSDVVFDHKVSLKGSLFLCEDYEINDTIIFLDDAILYIADYDEEMFSKIHVSQGVEVLVYNSTKLSITKDINNDGDIDLIDFGIDFDDDSEYIEGVPNNNLDAVLNEAYTIYVRCRWNSASPSAGHLCYLMGNPGAVSQGFELYHDGTNLKFTIFDPTNYTASYAFSPDPNRIYHIFAVRKADGTPHLFVDWEEVASNGAGTTAALDMDQEITIGNESDAVLTDHHDGKIYEFRIWAETEITSTNIMNYVFFKTAFGTTEDLKLYLNDGTGTDLTDSGPGGLDATLHGATWVDPLEWRIFRDLIMSFGSSLDSCDGFVKRIYCHGDITVKSGWEIVYEKFICGIGSTTGDVNHSEYRSTGEEIEIDDDTIPTLDITSMNISKDMNDFKIAEINLKTTQTNLNYLREQDTIKILKDTYTRFYGKIYESNPGPGGMTKLTAYDPIFSMKKLPIPRWIHGNMVSFRPSLVTKGTSPTLNDVDLSAIVSSSIWNPFISVNLLNTKARQLRIDTDHYVDVGDNSGNLFCSIEFANMNGGDILRFAVYLLLQSGTDDLNWYIYDMDEDSNNYDTVIVSGAIAYADIPSGAADWVVVNVADDEGRILCPKRIKFVLGDSDGTVVVRWYGIHGPLFGGAKSGTGADATEANLTDEVQEETVDGSPYDCGFFPAVEIEVMGDWNIKVDPSTLIYGSTSAEFPVNGPQPVFANETRRVSSTTWNNARITSFIDPMEFDDLITEVINSWYRDIIGYASIDVSTDEFPFIFIEDQSPIDAIIDQVKKLDGNLYYDYDETESMDMIYAEANTLLTDWDSLSDTEKLSRSFIIGKDIKGINPLNKYKLSCLGSNDVNKVNTDVIKRLYLKTPEGIITYTDYEDRNYKFSEVSDYDQSISDSIDFAQKIVEYEKDGYMDIKVLITKYITDSLEIFKTSNEILKISDGEKSFYEVLKVKTLTEKYSKGEWSIESHISDNPWREVDPKSKVERKLNSGFKGESDKGRVSIVPYSKSGLSTGLIQKDQSLTVDYPSIDESKVFDIAFEIYQEYVNTSGTYWILLGSSDDNPDSSSMQTSDPFEQIIVEAERKDVGGYVILFARITERDLLGEWNNCFDVKEIGVIKNASRPDYTDPCDVRTVLNVPPYSSPGYTDDLVSEDYLYRPYPKFLYNSALNLTISHLPSSVTNYLKYLWDMEYA